MRKGFTLIETLIVVVLVAVMFAVMVAVFNVILTAWSSQEERTGTDISVEGAIKRVVTVDNDFSLASPRMGLREAVAVSDHSGRDEIRVAVKQRAGDQPSLNAQGNPTFSCYIYYLYNSAESYPPAFKQGSYQIRRANLINATTQNNTKVNTASLDAGTFTYGSGDIIADNILSPLNVVSPSNLSVSSNMVTLDLSIMRDTETIRSRTEVKPRNI